MATLEDFKRLELKTGKILSAEPIEKSDKLYKLIVDLGDKKIQLVSGIKKDYSEEELIGKLIIIIANLEPAKFRGVESQGMLLAVTEEDGTVSLLTPDREVKVGSKIS